MGQAPAAPNVQAAYLFGKAKIEVSIDDREVARWLAEFLTPWFSTEAPGQADLHVRMTASAERFTTLACREAKSSLRPVPCFGLDSALVSYPGWCEEDGSTVVADKEFGCYYRVRDHQVEVVARPQDRLARIGLMRVVRELALDQTFGAGMHSMIWDGTDSQGRPVASGIFFYKLESSGFSQMNKMTLLK